MTEQHVAQTQVEFDYGQLNRDDWMFVQDARDQIRHLGKQTVESICEIGRLLTGVKARLPHGQWLPWLKAEFAWSETTARRFMDSYSLFRSAKLEDLPSLLELPPSAVGELAARSTPAEARQEIMQQIVQGARPTTQDVRETIHQHKVDRARSSVDRLHVEPVQSITAPTIRVEPEPTSKRAPARALLDRDQWEARFREVVHALARLALAADRDEHEYHREMVACDPDLRGEVMSAAILLHSALGDRYRDPEPPQPPDDRQLDIEDALTDEPEPTLSPPEPAPEELSEEFADEQQQPNGELRNGYADDPVELGRRVREARKAKGWTQSELAEAAGTHGPIISRIENGKLRNVGKATVQRVAAAVLTS
jgi:DNA-binding XRE family transcriptional regulator